MAHQHSIDCQTKKVTQDDGTWSTTSVEFDCQDDVQLCTYGGDCDQPAAYVLTRTDGMRRDGQTCYACREHRDPLTATMAQYVHGWGAVTFTIAEYVAPEPETDEEEWDNVVSEVRAWFDQHARSLTPHNVANALSNAGHQFGDELTLKVFEQLRAEQS